MKLSLLYRGEKAIANQGKYKEDPTPALHMADVQLSPAKHM